MNSRAKAFVGAGSKGLSTILLSRGSPGTKSLQQSSIDFRQHGSEVHFDPTEMPPILVATKMKTRVAAAGGSPVIKTGHAKRLALCVDPHVSLKAE